MPTITRQQAEALAALDWLFDESDRHRQTGRTFILALAYLRRAVRTGRWVDVEDHYDGRSSDEYLFRVVRQIADDAGIGLELERRHRFRVSHAPAAAQRWLFEEFIEGDVPALPRSQGVQGLVGMVARVTGAQIVRRSAPEPEKPPPPSLWERLNGDDVV